MIVQACLNGARARGYHPALPISSDELARDGAACIAAGAAELHVHAHTPDGRESLAEVDETVLALRRACPGTLIGVSTGAWIEGDEQKTRRSIGSWQELPDYASVNLSEPDAPILIDQLDRMRLGVEAGLATVADAERFVALSKQPSVFRVLIEMEEQNIERAMQEADGIASVLERHAMRRPILLHGLDATVWSFVRLARDRRWSTRVGLEDGIALPDGTIAPDNAALVAAAAAIFRAG